MRVYRETGNFPHEEMFGLTSQMRRAAVSVASNIVEGCARSSKADYVRFLVTAYGSAQEIDYQIGLAHRLGFLTDTQFSNLHDQSTESVKVLSGLIRSLQEPKA